MDVVAEVVETATEAETRMNRYRNDTDFDERIEREKRKIQSVADELDAFEREFL